MTDPGANSEHSDDDGGSDPWGEVADDWHGDPGPTAYANAAFQSLTQLLGQHGVSIDGVDVLDFGAGTGLLVDLLRHRATHVVALDPSKGMRRRLEMNAADWANVSVIANLDDLDDRDFAGHSDGPHDRDGPGEPTRFDLIVASSVLGFVDDYEGAVTALFERLRPGGWLVQWDWERDLDEGDIDERDIDERDIDERAETDDESDDEPHGLTRDQVSSVLRRVGGSDVTVETGFSIEVDGYTMSPLLGAARKPHIWVGDE